MIDLEYVTGSNYYFGLPTSRNNGDVIYVQCNLGSSNNLIVEGLGLPALFWGSGLYGTAMTISQGLTYAFTYYTGNNAWNTTAQAYPNWNYIAISNDLIPIPASVTMLLVDSVQVTTPFYWNASISTPSKSTLDIFDVNGFINFVMVIMSCSSLTGSSFISSGTQLLTLNSISSVCKVINLNNRLMSVLYTH